MKTATTTTTTDTAAQTILELAHIATKPITIHTDGSPLVRLPAGATIADMEQYLPQPLRIRECVGLRDIGDFLTYCRLYRTDGTIVTHSAKNGTMTATLDYHEPGKPSWATHIAALHLTPSPEWSQWTSILDRWLGQLEMAEFLEKAAYSNADTKPNAATLLESAKAFQATRNVIFKSAVRITNGDLQLTYDQKTQAGAGPRGTLAVPDTIDVHAPLYQGCEPVTILLRLYWRISDEGQICFRFCAPTLTHLIDKATNVLIERIQKALTCPVFRTL